MIAAALAFSPAIFGTAHLDDYSLFADGAFATPGGAWSLLSPERVRPLTNLTLWANYQLHGEWPGGYLLVNLLLHLTAVWLASRSLGRLLPPAVALLALTVFALHPLQTEPVAYIFARSTLLCGLGCWAAIAAWVVERYAWAVVATGLALLAKEEAVVLPVLFAFWAWPANTSEDGRWRRVRAPLGAMFALALAVGLRGLWATSQVKGSGAGFDVATPPLAYALSQGVVIWRYLRLLLVPVGLNFDPDLHPEPWLGALGWLGLLAMASLLPSAPRRWVWTGLLFLAPTSTLLPIDDLAADRRMYLAGACFAAALGLAVPRLSRGPVAVVGLLLAALSFWRVQVFATEESLWRDTVARSPAKVRPRIQLARAVPPVEALGLLEGLPSEARVAGERGRIYFDLGRPAEALREFGVALAADPGDGRALTNRGTALAALGQRQAALQDFARALAREPCLYPAWQNLHQLGQPLPVLGQCRFTGEQKKRLGLQ